MCGIVGLFAKNPAVAETLGRHFAAMLVEMTDRGPDSAGFAVYHDAAGAGASKITVLAATDDNDWAALEAALDVAVDGPVTLRRHANHAVIVAGTSAEALRALVHEHDAALRILSSGDTIEIFKEKGLPRQVIERFGVTSLKGTHALGHTRMATESAVTTEHSYPFSTGEDLCLVHNGSLSNHNRLRDKLRKHGVEFSTDNDSEVAAGYMTWRLREGDTLEQAIERSFTDLDGFFTFAIGTRDGFAVVRDPIACKPAVIAECDDWVAMASEYRAIAVLPGSEHADCWEPAPAQIYSWSH
ncbi:MAG: amidophosphoribosyltransferase [Gammaproteobacteria bacterium]|nr:amidophosphoribosyltransferase [Gammaproteobacteria bacterium]